MTGTCTVYEDSTRQFLLEVYDENNQMGMMGVPVRAKANFVISMTPNGTDGDIIAKTVNFVGDNEINAISGLLHELLRGNHLPSAAAKQAAATLLLSELDRFLVALDQRNAEAAQTTDTTTTTTESAPAPTA